MKKLTAYLTRQFLTDAAVLFLIVCFLLWMVNCLRSFDIVSVKGQGLDKLAVQALYTMPPLAISFFYICIGIGLVRALSALQTSHELHIIHTSGGIGGIWRATAVVCVIAGAFVLLLAHFIEPLANKQINILAEEVAADLVSSTLKPNRFTQVTPGVVLLIGGRETGGEITDFFADDRRNEAARRTYIASSARVLGDGDNYVLELRDGAVQNYESDGQYSEVRFTRYNLSIDSLTNAPGADNSSAQFTSYELITRAFQNEKRWPVATLHLLNRSAEGLRVIGICLFVLAISAFPSGRRTRIKLPLEAIVMLVAFGERGLSSYSPLGMGTGAVALIVGSGIVLAIRIWPRRPIAVEVPA
jgi:lipopolysaccharide export system permease protein